MDKIYCPLCGGDVVRVKHSEIIYTKCYACNVCNRVSNLVSVKLASTLEKSTKKDRDKISRAFVNDNELKGSNIDLRKVYGRWWICHLKPS